ncbi:hypothetical protein TNIN_458671 [Trichonephila inaurata madagascariensis]|uniref:Uncharacterized protein n=1 Tax=Trichonephila inaurata madagascariensis TaxID=2747483 RepID=A0A8X7C7Y4_9ARAC|nr:hypothetical protein TNIN_458671 [Trichonephila inaurata madagascariensis]
METRQVLSKKENKTSRRRETEWECLPDGFRCRTHFEVVVKSTHIQKEVKDIRRLPSPLIQRNRRQEENVNERAVLHPNRLKHSPYVCPGIPDSEPAFRQNVDFDKKMANCGGELADSLSNNGKESFREVRQQNHCNNSSNSNNLNRNFIFPNEDDLISYENLDRLSPQSKKLKHDQFLSRNDQGAATENKDILLGDNLICSQTTYRTKKIQNKSLDQSFECQKEDLKHFDDFNLDKEGGHNTQNLVPCDKDVAFLKNKTCNHSQLSPNVNGSFSISDAGDMGRGDFLRQEVHSRDNQYYGQYFYPEQMKPHRNSDIESPYKISDEETMLCKFNKGSSTDIHKNQTVAFEDASIYFKSKLSPKCQNETGIFYPNENIGIKQNNSERFSSSEVNNVIFESRSNDVDKRFGIHPCTIGPFSNSYSFNSTNGCEFSSNRSSFKGFANDSDDTLSDGDLINSVFKVHSNETKPQKNLPSNTISCLSSHQTGTITKNKDVLKMPLEKRMSPTAIDTELSWGEVRNKISESEISSAMVKRTVTPRTDSESNENARRKVSVGDLVEYFENLNFSCRDRKDKADDKRLVQIHFVYEEKNEKTNDQKEEEKVENYPENDVRKNKPSELEELQNHFVADGENQWTFSMMSDSKEDAEKEDLCKISNCTDIALPSKSLKASTEDSPSEPRSRRNGSPSPVEDILSESGAHERHFQLNDKQWRTLNSSKETFSTKAKSNAMTLKRTNSMPDFSKAKSFHSPRNMSNEGDLQIRLTGASCDQKDDKAVLNSKDTKKVNILKAQLSVQETEVQNTPKSTSDERTEVLDTPHSEAVSAKRVVSVRQRKVSLADFPLENPLEKLTKSTHPDMRKGLREAEGVRSTRRIFFIIKRSTFIAFSILMVLLLLVSEWIDLKPSR